MTANRVSALSRPFQWRCLARYCILSSCLVKKSQCRSRVCSGEIPWLTARRVNLNKLKPAGEIRTFSKVGDIHLMKLPVGAPAGTDRDDLVEKLE